MPHDFPQYSKISQLPISVWVEHDARSVFAMLRGYGDGREKIYQLFSCIQRFLTPHQSVEEIAEGYAILILASPRMKQYRQHLFGIGYLVFLAYAFPYFFRQQRGARS